MTDMGRCKVVFYTLGLILCVAGLGERILGQDIPLLRHDVVINEIHYDPDVKTERVEFVELYNTGPHDVNLAGWRLCDGIRYTFGPGAVLQAGGYVIAAQDWNSVVLKWSQLMMPVGDYEQVYSPFEGRLDNDGQTVTLCDAHARVVDRVQYQPGFPWPTVGDSMPRGSVGNGHSIQLMNPALDNDLGGSWRSAYPTPGEENTEVYVENTPPQIRQVDHSPLQPRGGEVVTITVKVTDPDGVNQVTLLYQTVDPGAYIPLTLPNLGSLSPNETKPNPDYEAAARWSSLPMHNDGLDGDVIAGDGVYTVQMPGSLQTHRCLVRYRITAEDNSGEGVQVPYADDPQPNFAYFVYDGVPAWAGAINPKGPASVNAVVEYPEEVMNSLPVYHLIARRSDVEDCTWLHPFGYTSEQAGTYYWSGTLVYDGRVYDHIRFRTRGGTWRHAMGKNMWKFDFNRGHALQARDDYGRSYATQWGKLNLSACIQQGNFWHRGEQGMFEAAGFRLYNLVGAEACKTHWLQYRIIDTADEAGPTQYDGDLWGLYLAIEQMDGRFLDEHGLPDGNLYKIDSQVGNALHNQGPTAASDGSDLRAFIGGYQSSPSSAWWLSNVDVDRYFSFRTVTDGFHNYDIGAGKNYYYYLNPQSNRWSIQPWDLDLTWADNMYDCGNSGRSPFKQYGLWNNTDLLVRRNNRIREIIDLLFNTDQAWQMLDELAAVIDDPNGGPSMVDVDRAMWDYNPVMISYASGDKGGQGRFYVGNPNQGITIPSSGGFPGMVQLMKNYVVYRLNEGNARDGEQALNSMAADPLNPNTPKVSYVGPADYPINALEFQTTAFSSPAAGGAFAAMQWRIAEVEPFSQFNAVTPDVTSGTVLLGTQQKWRYFKGLSAPSTDPEDWRQVGFNDNPAQTAWLEGTAPVGYSPRTSVGTPLNDMRTGYSTIYLRKIFTVTDLEAIATLNLEVRYDDGFVAWINGVLVASDNVSGPDLAYNALALRSKEVSDLTAIPVSNPKEILKAGENVLAIQVLNSSLVSNDCYFDARLVIPTEGSEEPEDEEPARPIVQGRTGLYEIQASWQSGEISPFNSQIRIPAGAVEPGRTYRVRCRMKDTTGRWSHWSDPNQFVTGAAALPDRPGLPLRITEIMYNPPVSPSEDGWDPEEFEYIELMNVGSASIDLAGVRIVEGITFAFAGSAVTQLGPGQYVLVVENRVAFECRYGTAMASQIAGEYSGKLSNGGERIKVKDLQTGVVMDFAYDDAWYGATDGKGSSLVLMEPGTVQPDPLGQRSSWRASHRWGGSPGGADIP